MRQIVHLMGGHLRGHGGRVHVAGHVQRQHAVFGAGIRGVEVALSVGLDNSANEVQQLPEFVVIRRARVPSGGLGQEERRPAGSMSLVAAPANNRLSLRRQAAKMLHAEGHIVRVFKIVIPGSGRFQQAAQVLQRLRTLVDGQAELVAALAHHDAEHRFGRPGHLRGEVVEVAEPLPEPETVELEYRLQEFTIEVLVGHPIRPFPRQNTPVVCRLGILANDGGACKKKAAPQLHVRASDGQGLSLRRAKSGRVLGSRFCSGWGRG